MFHLFLKNKRKVCNILYIVAHCLVQVCRTWLIVSGALTRYSLTILYNSTLKPLLNDNSIQHSLLNIAACSTQCQSNTTFSTIAQKVLNANPLHWQTHIFCSCDVSRPTTKCSVHNASVELVGGDTRRERIITKFNVQTLSGTNKAAVGCQPNSRSLGSFHLLPPPLSYRQNSP